MNNFFLKYNNKEDIRRPATYTAPSEVFEDLVGDDDEIDPFKQRTGSRRILDRQNEYHSRRLKRVISPERLDPFAEGEVKGDTRSYADVMREVEIEKEEQRIKRKIEEKKREEQQKAKESSSSTATISEVSTQKKRRWDMETPVVDRGEVGSKLNSEWSRAEDETPSISKSRWDETPRTTTDDEMDTPRKRSRWDVTPQVSTKKSRWDETPTHPTVQMGATPVGNLGLLTPTPGHLVPITPEGQ